MNGLIFDIQSGSLVDGPGVRTTVFLKGCNLDCAWCHNPESKSGQVQMMLYSDKCTGCGKCKAVCHYSQTDCDFCGKCELYCPADARRIVGKTVTADEVLQVIVKDKPFYANSGGGVTVSGGECMLQIDFLTELLRKCKAQGIHTAVDTAGNVPWEYFERILPYTDLFLYDVKLTDTAAHRKWTGAGNERILENLTKLLSLAPVWVRVPVIAGVNDSVDEMTKIKVFLSGRAKRVELLPYHAMGENKYAALGLSLAEFAPPDDAALQELKNIFA